MRDHIIDHAGAISDCDRRERSERSLHPVYRVSRTAGTEACISLYLETLRDTLHTTLKPMAITISGQSELDRIDPEKMQTLLTNYLLRTKCKYVILISEWTTHHHYHGIIWRTEKSKPRQDMLTYSLKVTLAEITHLKTWVTYMFKTEPNKLQFIKHHELKKYLATKVFKNMKKTKLKILAKTI